MNARLIACIGSASALAVMPVSAPAAVTVGGNGVTRFVYDDERVPVIECQPLYVTDIELQPGEGVLNIAVGDAVRWVLSPAASGANTTTPHILIKPTEERISTNVIITTTRRTYDINLHSRAAGGMQRVGFIYAEPAAPAATAAVTPQPVVRDTAYRMSGDVALYPTRVSNDGVHTYLEFPPTAQTLPVLLATGQQGDALINYRILADHTYIVDGVPAALALVHGSGRGQQRAVISREHT